MSQIQLDNPKPYNFKRLLFYSAELIQRCKHHNDRVIRDGYYYYQNLPEKVSRLHSDVLRDNFDKLTHSKLNVILSSVFPSLKKSWVNNILEGQKRISDDFCLMSYKPDLPDCILIEQIKVYQSLCRAFSMDVPHIALDRRGMFQDVPECIYYSLISSALRRNDLNKLFDVLMSDPIIGSTISDYNLLSDEKYSKDELLNGINSKDALENLIKHTLDLINFKEFSFGFVSPRNIVKQAALEKFYFQHRNYLVDVVGKILCEQPELSFDLEDLKRIGEDSLMDVEQLIAESL